MLVRGYLSKGEEKWPTGAEVIGSGESIKRNLEEEKTRLQCWAKEKEYVGVRTIVESKRKN